MIFQMQGESANSSKGILISHIIKKPHFHYRHNRIIDIEAAVAFPDSIIDENGNKVIKRDPALAWADSTNKNGIWFLGKKINDWMDDHAPRGAYPFEGGLVNEYKAYNRLKEWHLSPPTSSMTPTGICSLRQLVLTPIRGKARTRISESSLTKSREITPI
jgi:hypothetical protein